MSLPTTSGGATFAKVTSTSITNYGNGVFFIHTLNAEGQYSVDGGGVWYTFPTINQIRVMRITAKELLVQREAGTAKVYMIPEQAEFLV
jgi:hypothetical protein